MSTAPSEAAERGRPMTIHERFLYGAMILIVFLALALLTWFVKGTFARQQAFVRAGRTFEQVDVILSQTETLLGMVGVLLTIMTIIGSAFAIVLTHTLMKRADEATQRVTIVEDQMRRFEKAADKVDKFAAAQESNSLRVDQSLQSAEEALHAILEFVHRTLPRLTSSQQIPVGVARTIEPLATLFSRDPTRGARSSARMHYALALNQLAIEPRTLETEQYLLAVEHLREGLKCAKDNDLRIDIQMRLFQSYRQLGQLDAAAECLRQLASEGGAARFHARWGEIVLELQRGFESGGENRRAAFARAAGIAGEVLGQPGWEQHATANATFAYYCSKALWAFYFSRGTAVQVSNFARFGELFAAATKKAREQLEAARGREDDEIIRTIYGASLAYVMIADSAIRAYPVGRDIQALLDDTQSQAMDFRAQGLAIYDDHRERLMPARFFDEFVAKLRDFVHDPGSMDHFYRGI